MAHAESRAVSFIATDDPLAWTFPAGFLLLASTFICLALFVLYPRAMAPACEMKMRVVLTFAVPAAAGALLLPMAVARFSTVLRVAIGIVAAVVVGALTVLAVGSLFPSFC